MPLTLRRRSLIVLLLAALVLPFVPRAADAAIDGRAEASFVQLINQARVQAGLPALSVRSDLVSVARRHSARMADAEDLHHNPSLAGDVSGWQKLGENVGRGPTVETIHVAFMGSPGHRANVLSADFTEVGVGVEVREGGRIWVTEVFRLSMSSPESAPAPGPEPAPAPEPAPSSRPELAPEAPAATPDTAAADARPVETVTAAADAPTATVHGVDHAELLLAQLSARDLGVRTSEALPTD